MRAVILAAGFGTRLAPLGLEGPKALLPVRGRPALDWILLALDAVEGLEAVDLVSNANFYPQFEEWKSRSGARIPITILNNGATSNETRLGAVGDLLRYLDQQPLQRRPNEMLVLASDNLWSMDLNSAVQHFRRRKCSGCLLREVSPEDLCKRGVARVAEDGRLVELLEKPSEPPSRWAVPPVYYLTREAIAFAMQYPRRPRPPDAIGHLLAWLCKRVPVWTYRVEGDWLDIGDPEDYQRAASNFLPFGCEGTK